MLQNISNLGVGLVLAFYFGWSLTLLVLAFIPFMIIAGYLQTYMMTGFADKVCEYKKKMSENLFLFYFIGQECIGKCRKGLKLKR